MVKRSSAALALFLFVGLLSLVQAADPNEYVIRIEEDNLGGWQRDGLLPPPPGMDSDALLQDGLRVERGAAGPELVLRAPFPHAVGLLRLVGEDRAAWGRGRTLRLQVFVPASAGAAVSAQLIAHHKIWGWFVTKPTREFDTGRWTTVYWPLGAAAGDWTSNSGQIQWNDTLRYDLHRVGVRFFSESGETVDIRVREVAIEGLAEPPPPLTVRKLVRKPERAARGRRVEFSFEIGRDYENPFDPEQIAVDAVFKAPDGTRVELPGFYFQDYLRRQLRDGAEECEPVGKAEWRLRYLPLVAGEHTFSIVVRDFRGDSFETPPQTFLVEDAPFRGILRVDPDDSKYLSFTNGEFFYPLGLIVRSPDDNREPYRYEFAMRKEMGTYAYDYYFNGMAKAGVNFTRVWMSAWWTAIEWTHGYRSDYAGLGRYNQLNAWRMDYVLDLAEKLGIYVDITLHNHGQFRAQSFDTEWYDNPYYKGQGGTVERPEEFWSDELSRHYLKKRLRYMIARWSSSPSVAFWELCNEVDLVGHYNSRMIRSWHEAIGRWLKEADPYKHIVTTHFTASKFDPNVVGLPEMEVAQSTAYRTDMIQRSLEMWQSHAVFGKPVYINEFGVGRSHIELQHNLHAGLWASSVMPFSGPALFWWWPYVQEKDEYYQYEALRRFHEGEDYRGRDFQLTHVLVQPAEIADSAAEPLGALGMQNASEARIWFYDTRMYRTGGARERMAPVARPIPTRTASLDGLRTGEYTVEFWDTWKGRPLANGKSKVRHDAPIFEIKIPPFERDLACKINRVGD
jgi:hypothetical protein